MIQLYFSLLLHLVLPSSLTWLKNMEEAKGQAKKEQKYILLNFSGSDWCIPCMRLEKDVFDANVFADYAAGHLVLVNADFPRNNKNQLTKQQQKINDVLAEKYNPQGSLPFTLLLDSDGNTIKIWDGYYKDGAENFVAEIKVLVTKQ